MRRSDLQGQTFGQLEVLERAEPDKEGKSRWLCRCSCGREKIIAQRSLRRILSCGCLRRACSKWAPILTAEFLRNECIEKGQTFKQIAKRVGCSQSTICIFMKRLDILLAERVVGKKFSKLTLLNQSHIKAKHSYWNVLCDCGKRAVVRLNSILSGATISCGCVGKTKDWNGVGNLSGCYWRSLQRNAEKRELSFDIEIEYGWELFNAQGGRCALSGVPIALDRRYSVNMRKRLNLQTASLDRIDSSQGYVPGNVQWVHRDINRMKNGFAQEHFILMCRQVAENSASIHK